MLDLLLNTPKDKRNAMIERLNTGTKKRIFDNIYTMTEELGLDEIPDFETRVNMRYELIQRFPDMVFWDYVEVANPVSAKRKVDVPDFERFTTCKISTRGDVVIFNGISRLYVKVVEPKNRYPCVRLNYNVKTHHRLIASTFIPKPDRFKQVAYRNLTVNHIDMTRWNNRIENLEWVLCAENQRHCHRMERYDETKYFLFRVAADNGFGGRRFVLSEHDLHLIGTNFCNIRKILTRKYTHKGFHVEMLHHEDIEGFHLGFPDDIAELLRRNHLYFSINTMPVIGTVIGGKYKGFTFSLFGSKEISRYFNRCATEAVMRGELRSHFGCTFRRTTHREAIPLHNRITQEIVDDARQNKPRYPSRNL